MKIVYSSFLLYALCVALSSTHVPTHTNTCLHIHVHTHSSEFTVDVDGNVTGTELPDLKPATTYQVTVYGMNTHGQGMASEPETVMTLVPEGAHHISLSVHVHCYE